MKVISFLIFFNESRIIVFIDNECLKIKLVKNPVETNAN
jgi:hypothetical protein